MKDTNQLNNNMIPIKDKKYMINCQGPYDYNRYMGEGVFTGEVTTDIADETCYGFVIPAEKEVCFFVEEEIVAEIVSDKAVKTEEEIQNQIDSENHYCETCGSCGETGCCPPVNCQAVKCKYGETNLKDYECFQNQWEIMFNALQAIKDGSDEPPSLEEMDHGAFWITNKERAENALKAVDKEWDKLYSKENHE